jgi:hypothetical protein
MYCHTEELQDNQILLGFGLPLAWSPAQCLYSDFETEKNEKNHVPGTNFLLALQLSTMRNYFTV